MIEVDRIVVGALSTNCYLVTSGDDAVIVDPGDEFELIDARVAERGARVHAVLNTHAHADHLSAAVAVVEAYGAPFHLHSGDAPLLARANFYRAALLGLGKTPIPALDVALDEPTALHFGTLEVEVLHTPGHTPGSVCLWIGDEVFTGDTISSEEIGRSDLPGGDQKVLEASLAALAERLPPDVTIRPGHGAPARAGDVLADWSSLPELRG